MAPNDAQVQVHGYGAPAPAPVMMPPKRVFSIWWPMSFLILWLVFCATGGGLIGGSFNVGTISYCYEVGACDEGPDESMLIPGLVFVSLGGVCASVFWILLIVWLVKRSRARASQPSVVYFNQPMVPGMGMAYQPQGWHPQPYPPPPQQLNVGQMQPPNNSSSPPIASSTSPDDHSMSTHTPHLNASGQHTQDSKKCSSCGAPVTTPYCAHCGARNA